MPMRRAMESFAEAGRRRTAQAGGFVELRQPALTARRKTDDAVPMSTIAASSRSPVRRTGNPLHSDRG